jgi:hypothetical protein
MYKGKYKTPMRSLAINHGLEGGVAKAALILPSPAGGDVKEGIERGLFNRDTFIVAAEANPKSVSKVRDLLKSQFDRFYLHEGQLHTLPLFNVLEGNGLSKLDFAFVDSCTQLTGGLIMWIREELCRFCNRMAFTFAVKIRNHHLMQRTLMPTVKGDFDKISAEHVEWAKGSLVRLRNMCKSSVTMDTNMLGLAATTYALSLGLSNSKPVIECVYPYDDTYPMMLALVTGDKRVVATAENKRVADFIKYVPNGRFPSSMSSGEKAALTKRLRS